MYFITRCFPGCPDAYLSVACWLVKYDFRFYLWSGFSSKIVKIYLYILLFIGLDSLSTSFSSGSWTSLIIPFIIIVLIQVVLLVMTKLSESRIFKAYDIYRGKLNSHGFEMLRLNKSDYDLNFKLTNKQSPLDVPQAEPRIQVCCNGGLFNTETKEPLGQTILNRKIVNYTKLSLTMEFQSQI